MFDWSQFKWQVEEDTHRGMFVMKAPVKDFFPIGEIDYLIDSDWRESEVQIDYVPEKWETMDQLWLNQFAPKTSYEFVRWINASLEEYVDTIGLDEFHERIDSVLGDGQPPEGVVNTRRGIRKLIKKEGIARLVFPRRLEFLQTLNVLQGEFDCSFESYFSEH